MGLPPGARLIHTTGGAEASPRAFEVDLDMQGPEDSVVEFSHEMGEAAGGPLVWTLVKDQVEVRIKVTSSTPDLYEWTARIPVLLHGKRYFIKVDDAGEPIRFTGGDLRNSLRWSGVAWQSWQ